MILKDVKIRIGCSDFEPMFTLHRLEPPGHATSAPGLALPMIGIRVTANWDVQHVQNVESWKPDCAAAFQEAVARARSKFDITWSWA